MTVRNTAGCRPSNSLMKGPFSKETTNSRVTVSFITRRGGRNMLETSSKGSWMDRAFSMVQGILWSTKVSSNTVYMMVMVNTIGKMGHGSRETISRGWSMGRGDTTERTAKSFRACGNMAALNPGLRISALTPQPLHLRIIGLTTQPK